MFTLRAGSVGGGSAPLLLGQGRTQSDLGRVAADKSLRTKERVLAPLRQTLQSERGWSPSGGHLHRANIAVHCVQ